MATVDDILRATLVFDILDGSVANMVFTYRVSAGTEPSYTTIVNAIRNGLESAYVGVLDSIAAGVNGTEVNLAEYNFTTHQWDGKSTATVSSMDGTAAGDHLPSGIAGVCRFITDSARRQGRKFVPGIVESLCAGNTLNATLIADLVLLAVDLNDDITAGTATLRPTVFNDVATSPHYETWSDYIQTSFVNTYAGYQRRRQPGDGI